MKKVLAVVITMAMLVSMFALVSNAGNHVNVDGAFFTNDVASGSHNPDHVPLDADKNVLSDASGNGNLGSVYGLGYTYFHTQGWVGDSDELIDLGLAVNGGDIEWGKGIEDKNLWNAEGKPLTGFEYNLRFNFNHELLEGEVKIELYEKMADGSTKVAKTFTYTNAAGDPNVKTYSNKFVGDGAAIGVWVQGTNNVASLEFTTAGSFNGIILPIYWASNPSVGNGPKAEWKWELFKFQYNPDYTFTQNPVKSGSVTSEGDNNPVAAASFDEALEAGTYIVRFTLTNPDYTEMLQSAQDSEPKEKTPYLVLPKLGEKGENPDPSKFTYSTAEAFNFVVVGEDGINEFFVANPDNVDAPSQGGEPVPQTGDATVAMFAVVLVAAMGAAVVFSKKRAF